MRPVWFPTDNRPGMKVSKDDIPEEMVSAEIIAGAHQTGGTRNANGLSSNNIERFS